MDDEQNNILDVANELNQNYEGYRPQEPRRTDFHDLKRINKEKRKITK
jgi:hypothetical protein